MLMRYNELNAELARHAQAIRQLGKRAVSDIVEIGRHLIQAKDLVNHGGWLQWLSQEFGWSEDTALNFIHCNELAKSRDFRDLSLPVARTHTRRCGLFIVTRKLARPTRLKPLALRLVLKSHGCQ